MISGWASRYRPARIARKSERTRYRRQRTPSQPHAVRLQPRDRGRVDPRLLGQPGDGPPPTHPLPPDSLTEGPRFGDGVVAEELDQGGVVPHLGFGVAPLPVMDRLLRDPNPSRHRRLPPAGRIVS